MHLLWTCLSLCRREVLRSSTEATFTFPKDFSLKRFRTITGHELATGSTTPVSTVMHRVNWVSTHLVPFCSFTRSKSLSLTSRWITGLLHHVDFVVENMTVFAHSYTFFSEWKHETTHYFLMQVSRWCGTLAAVS